MRHASGNGESEHVRKERLTTPADVQYRILQAVDGLAYGSVEIVVHDSRVVQIERREKVRLERSAEAATDEAPARDDDSARRRSKRM